jgi:hypothetical protein
VNSHVYIEENGTKYLEKKKVEVELQEHLAMEPTIQWKGE